MILTSLVTIVLYKFNGSVTIIIDIKTNLKVCIVPNEVNFYKYTYHIAN